MTSREMLLRRGRGAGFLAAIADPASARDDVLTCIVHDHYKRDTQVEQRARYFAELVERLEVPLEPVLAHAAKYPDDQWQGSLAFDVLGAAWARAHPPMLAWLARDDAPSAVLDGIARVLWGYRWATAEQLPRRVAAHFAHYDEPPWKPPPSVEPPLRDDLSLDELLDLSVVYRDHRGREQPWYDALRRRVRAEDRPWLAEVVANDHEPTRVRAAARLLADLGDPRLLPLAEEWFARDLPPDGPAIDCTRRTALRLYVQRLSPEASLPVVREWWRRSGFFRVPAIRVLEEHATPADREMLEEYVRDLLPADRGFRYATALGTIARIGDPRSAPLFAEVCDIADYSYARTRALLGLARMPAEPGATALLREALWDAEDDAAAAACSAAIPLDADARARVAALAADRVATAKLRAAAAARLAAG